MTGSKSERARRHIVLLVHGIRDFALWQTTVRTILEEHGLTAEAINYGRINLLQFLVPIPYFRNKAIAKVWHQIEIVKEDNQDALLSVIAHSFGTYVIARLMREKFNARFHRVIFCGSVVPYDFPFEQFKDRFTHPIVNEVGTRDIWPALAESITFGYGSAGTYGFRRPLVDDRWHNGAHHGFFLNSKFCEELWCPLLTEGKIVPGVRKPEAPAVWLQGLSVFKTKYVVITILLGYFVNFVSGMAIFTAGVVAHRETTAEIANPLSAVPHVAGSVTSDASNDAGPPTAPPALFGRTVQIIYGRSDAERMREAKDILTEAGAITRPQAWLDAQVPAVSVIRYANDREREATAIRERLRPQLGEFQLEIVDIVGDSDIQVYLGRRTAPQ